MLTTELRFSYMTYPVSVCLKAVQPGGIYSGLSPSQTSILSGNWGHAGQESPGLCSWLALFKGKGCIFKHKKMGAVTGHNVEKNKIFFCLFESLQLIIDTPVTLLSHLLQFSTK